MDLMEKFRQGIDLHTYQRIDSTYKVNVFLGYNDDGQMSMVMTENGNVSKVKSSKQIDVQLSKREDGKIALSFDLLDNKFSSMFVVFCKDMIVYCERAGREEAIANAVVRWRYWQELFGKKSGTILDKNEIKGLIGELVVLEKKLIPSLGVKYAIESWMGPLLGHKDFEVNNTWYEIKSINEGALQVSISSVEQLESSLDGHLVIVRIEDGNGADNKAFTLNQIVTKLIEMINDPEDMDSFRKKLNSIGYNFDTEYDEIYFSFKGMQSYKVTEQFPRICRESIPAAVGNIKYTILIEGIEKFKED